VQDVSAPVLERPSNREHSPSVFTADEQSLLLQPSRKRLLRDRDLLAAIPAKTLDGGEGGLRIEIEVVRVNPPHAVPARPPFATHVVTRPHRDKSPAPCALAVLGMLTIRPRDMSSSARDGPRQEVEEQTHGITDPLMAGLILRKLTESTPAAGPEVLRHLRSEGLCRLCELEEEAPSDGEVGDDRRRSPMLLAPERALAKRGHLSAKPLVELAVARSEPLNEGSEDLRIVAACGIGLAFGEAGPGETRWRDLNHQKTGAKRMPPRDVLPGRQNEPARRLGGFDGGVRAHPLPAGVVALGPEQTVCLAMVPLDVPARPRRGEVVDDEDRVFGGEGDALQRVARG
jgi:hypothetical protein